MKTAATPPANQAQNPDPTNGSQGQANTSPGTNGTLVQLSPRPDSRATGRPSVWDTLTDHLRRSDGAERDDRPIGRWLAAAFLSGCLVGWVLAAAL